MELTNSAVSLLRQDEKVALCLRALYEEAGYRLYRMGTFEEYDLYMQNKPFLMGDDVITFTGADGRLMALKPDVTLSIAKNTPAGQTRRVYYSENVFRRSRQTGEYREISQMGIEFLGGAGIRAEAEVLALAARSLAAVGNWALDLSHMELIEAMLAPFSNGLREAARSALKEKSPHAMRAVAGLAGIPPAEAECLAAFVQLSGPFSKALPKAEALTAQVPAAAGPLAQLRSLYEMLEEVGVAAGLRLDFSILNDADYYNGLIFQGFVRGASAPVLAGGRYDSLLQRFGKEQGALGFGLYLNELAEESLLGTAGMQEAGKAGKPAANAPRDGFLNIALPKGRMGDEVYRLFAAAGMPCQGVLEESRRLVFEDAEAGVRYFLVKPQDVDIYVEHGAADIGVVGRDVLLESGADVLELLDLQLGICRLAVAGRKGYAEDPARPLRVATKYPAVTRRYYAARSRSVEIIPLHGSIELAPLLGLADVVVDIVQSGGTLRENGLAVLAEVEPSSARLIANRAAWRFKSDKIRALTRRMEELVYGAPAN